ncbi:MAG: hypothetical protein ACKVTZ_09545 [Bacteroidia bacterium]
MNIKELLQNKYAKETILTIRDWIGEDAEKFATFMELFLQEDALMMQRAAWVLGHVGQVQPQLLLPYLSVFVQQLQRKDVHDAVKRNILRVLPEIEIPEEYQGELVIIGFDFLHSNETPAIKTFAMTMLYHICLSQPELMPELKQVIEERLPFESKAFQSRGRKILKGKRKLQ